MTKIEKYEKVSGLKKNISIFLHMLLPNVLTGKRDKDIKAQNK